jgi:hypothetical protein
MIRTSLPMLSRVIVVMITGGAARATGARESCEHCCGDYVLSTVSGGMLRGTIAVQPGDEPVANLRDYSRGFRMARALNPRSYR